jgi:predicted nucleic acid-binding protein
LARRPTTQAAEAAFDAWVTRAEPAAVVVSDFEAARSLIRSDRVRLRTPDALHLAIARRLACRLATLDRAMSDAALGIGAPIVPL